MKNFLFRLTHPSFWFQNAPTDAHIDALINQAIDDRVSVKMTSSYTVQLGTLRVWVGNWPYAYGLIENMPEALPYPLTRVRLRNYVIQELAAKLKGART